jgi:hypothetical protein
MRHHGHMRVPTSTQLELIEAALKVDLELAAHLKKCTECSEDVEIGTCPVADEMYSRVRTAAINLKRIGWQSGVELL